MPTTRRSDLVIATEILQEAVKGAFAGIEILNGSPAVVVKNTLPRAYVGGQTIKIPYFNTLGEADDIAVEGDALQPAKVSETSESTSVAHSGKAFEATWWSQLAADPASDPYVEGGRQIAIALRRRVDKALIDVASAALAPMTVDYSGVGGRKIDYDMIIEGRMKFGDQQSDIAMLCVHSKVLGDMFKVKDSTGRPLLTESITMPGTVGGPQGVNTRLPSSPEVHYFFGGIPVYVSDRLAPDANSNYTSLILKKESLVFWYNGDIIVDTAKDILANSQLAASHLYYAAYRYQRLMGSSFGGVALVKHL